MSETEIVSQDLAVLVGNGLSVAFNADLNLRLITEEMLRRIRESEEGGEQALEAMKRVAERALPSGVRTEEDFEVLVGAFGAEGRALSYLADLAAIVSADDEDLTSAFAKVNSFASRVQDLGVSHVLEVIFERSRATALESANLHSLVRSILNAFSGRVTFANLNYDSLLLAALLTVCDRNQLADGAWGKGMPGKEVRVERSDGTVFKASRLRERIEDFPKDRRILVLHPHGSLAYWREETSGVHVKVELEKLEDAAFWTQLRQEELPLRPDVVLANQDEKSLVVREYPFSLAYERLQHAFKSARSWLIVGYSFRDEVLNAVLAREFDQADNPPNILVVTRGVSPSRAEVEAALGWDSEQQAASQSWLTINRDGAFGFEETNDWRQFVQESEGGTTGSV